LSPSDFCLSFTSERLAFQLPPPFRLDEHRLTLNFLSLVIPQLFRFFRYDVQLFCFLGKFFIRFIGRPDNRVFFRATNPLLLLFFNLRALNRRSPLECCFFCLFFSFPCAPAPDPVPLPTPSRSFHPPRLHSPSSDCEQSCARAAPFIHLSDNSPRSAIVMDASLPRQMSAPLSVPNSSRRPG